MLHSVTVKAVSAQTLESRIWRAIGKGLPQLLLDSLLLPLPLSPVLPLLLLQHLVLQPLTRTLSGFHLLGKVGFFLFRSHPDLVKVPDDTMQPNLVLGYSDRLVLWIELLIPYATFEGRRRIPGCDVDLLLKETNP